MSENIQSIANGSFVLGQTSATNFVAGPGITIDSPSAGTVRIGNDETVLWSGTCTSGNTATISENVSGFERIGMECYCHNGANYTTYAEVPVNSTAVSLVGVSFWPGEVDFTEASVVNTTLTCYGTIVLSPNLGNKSQGTITKIIGINRISGSNA